MTEPLIGSICVDFFIGSIVLIFWGGGGTPARLGRFASTQSCVKFLHDLDASFGQISDRKPRAHKS